MRKLTLKKETITELGGDDLAAVVGGDVGTTSVKVCIPSRACPPLTNGYPCTTLDATNDCPTRDACFTAEGCA